VSELRDSLKREFKDPDTRYAYAESFLNTRMAAQIKTLREQRGKTQAELAILCGTKQAGIARFEDVSHSVWKTDSLWKIARALGVRLDISFETFGSLLDEKESFSREYLQRPEFQEDPAFIEPQTNEIRDKRPVCAETALAVTIQAGAGLSAQIHSTQIRPIAPVIPIDGIREAFGSEKQKTMGPGQEQSTHSPLGGVA